MQSAHERKFHQRDGVGQWDVFQVTLTGQPAEGNPFQDVALRAEFEAPSGRRIAVSGFYDDENSWKARFSPDELGDWRWSARLEGPGLAVERSRVAGGRAAVPIPELAIDHVVKLAREDG